MTTTVRLLYPVTINGQEITELTMRRPRVKDSLIHEKQFPDKKSGTFRV